MRVCLISAATATDFEDARDARDGGVFRYSASPQLGILALAAVLDRLGKPPSVLNLNSFYYEYLESGRAGVDSFAHWAAEAIVSSAADVYGFSAVCNSYPLTVRIAEQVKRIQPRCVTVFGGPQASVVDLQTLAAFPFVDFILRGEADETLPLLLAELENSRQLTAVPGLTHRTVFGPVRNCSAQVIADLDSLPLPAFHLTGELENAAIASLELGRGCPYACSFCSTNDFFRRKFRLKSPQRVLADMRSIAASYGVRSFDLVHDMFTVDRRRVIEFCECMLSSGDCFEWFCSARTDSVDEELLSLMSDAGCRAIFFGVETGSRRMQRIIGKDLDIDRAMQIIAFADQRGIKTDVSLISGFPEENWEDVGASLEVYMHSLRHPHSFPQFNLLAPLAETPIHSKYRDCLTLEELCSDVSHQGRKHNELDRELIRRNPDIFPNFYLVPTPHLDRQRLFELREFLLGVPDSARWLMTAIHQTTSGILDIFSAWRAHRVNLRPGLDGWSLRTYYMQEDALAEFVEFVRRHLGGSAAPAVRCLIAFYETISEAKATRLSAPEGEIASNPRGTDVPVRTDNVYTFELDWDLLSVIEHLKQGDGKCEVDRSVRFFRTEPGSSGDLRIFETSPLFAAGLWVCDGSNNVRECVAKLSSRFMGSRRDRRLAAECVLEALGSKQLIRIYRL